MITAALLLLLAFYAFVLFLGWRFAQIRAARDCRQERAERPRDEGAEIIYLARRIG